MPIRAAQIVQEELDKFRIRLILPSEYTSKVGQELVQRLCELVGDVEVRLESVEHITRIDSGKFKAVISEVEK